MLEIYNVKSSEEAKTILCTAEKKKSALLRLLNDEQTRMLFDYEDSSSILLETERREAFVQGVRFATQFFLEATK